MSDVKKFNLFVLFLFLGFALILLVGCCPHRMTEDEYRQYCIDAREWVVLDQLTRGRSVDWNEYQYVPSHLPPMDTVAIKAKARARVEQWKKQGVLK